jgi:hypothetical protein
MYIWYAFRTQEYYYSFTNQIHQTNYQEIIAYIFNYNNKNQINQANYQKPLLTLLTYVGWLLRNDRFYNKERWLNKIRGYMS